MTSIASVLCNHTLLNKTMGQLVVSILDSDIEKYSLQKDQRKTFWVILTHFYKLMIARCVKSADCRWGVCVGVSFINIKTIIFFTLRGRPFFMWLPYILYKHRKSTNILLEKGYFWSKMLDSFVVYYTSSYVLSNHLF